ncbi:N-acetylglucosamine-6-phosphate deacetylase [Alicyclobacillus shizuokensis]|uniref:N-acetylglucosamine-6-phosphate deacetylase n=1 Tax=Alicyclobacillus shizuokensis TaxID=392014 RepID=UPI00082D3D08|nr:N-acetylglucosamine-6-phosphate deacetylase [Alicyclobacillus shizuokensis]
MKGFVGNRLAENGHLESIRVEVTSGRISNIKVCKNVDASLPLIVPGFIDVHVHGGGGADTMDANEEAFEAIAATHAKYGTTSLLLTTVTESIERIDKVIDCAKSYMKKSHGTGATVVGLHLEGPFIHPDKPGAQRQDCIIEPDPSLVNRWLSSGIVRMITMAPERPHAQAVAELAKQKGVIVAAGHTTADEACMQEARLMGFSHLTHLCNAMNPFLHRDVGPIGAVISDEAFTADLICDGIHVHPAMIKALIRSIGSERLMLITDAMRAAAMPPGTYELGGLEVYVRDNECRLSDGTLAGSVLTMSRAYQLVQSLGGVSPIVAQRMSSLNPAQKLGLTTKGKIDEGYDADLVWLDPSGEVLRTVVNGRVVFER